MVTEAKAARGSTWIQMVRAFADEALRLGQDRFGPRPTPLLVDGVDARTGAPVTWLSGDALWILSNLASQQLFFRVLDGLTALTGSERYRAAAQQAAAYALAALRPGGLLAWGGHMAVDLHTGRPVWAEDKGPVHELKCHFPAYDLLWQADRDGTGDFIATMWESHVRDWHTLEFTRHGRPPAYPVRNVWARPYEPAPVFFTGQGLTFINAGTDLMWAAGWLAALSGEAGPYGWAVRLLERYVAARDPHTGLSGYQFSRSVLPGPRGRGDRAEAQFGDVIGDDVNEATLVVARQIQTIVGRSALAKLTLAERLGIARGAPFLTRTAEDLEAWARVSFDPEQNVFHPLLISGRRLTGFMLPRDGYYGPRGDRLEPLPVDALILLAYLRAFRLTRRVPLADAAGLMGFRLSLLAGPRLEDGPPRSRLAVDGADGDALALMAALEAYQVTGLDAFLAAAEAEAHRLIRDRLVNGLFVASRRHRFAKFDAMEALAVLQLGATLVGRSAAVAPYPGAESFFGAAWGHDGHRIDNAWIYRRLTTEEHQEQGATP